VTEKKESDESLRLMSLRLPNDMIDEMEKMIKKADRFLKANGNKTKSETTLSDVIRLVIGRGIQVLRQEMDDEDQKNKRSSRDKINNEQSERT
jgi:hypothetical protein